MTACSPGTARPRASASRTATGSPATGQRADDLRRDLGGLRHGAAVGQARRDSPGPGRRRSAARPAHGMLALSPRAVERLESSPPALAPAQAVPPDQEAARSTARFSRARPSTRRRCCALKTALDGTEVGRESIGGLPALHRTLRCQRQALINDWVDRTTPWIANLARDPATRSSNTSDVPCGSSIRP